MSDTDSSDSDVNRAIALSLESLKQVKKPEIIDLLSDDEDGGPCSATLGKSGATKKGQAEQSSVLHNSIVEDDTGTSVSNNREGQLTLESFGSQLASSRPLGLSGFDRKKMEEERLARAKKRKASSISPPPANVRLRKYQENSTVMASKNQWNQSLNSERGGSGVGLNIKPLHLVAEKKQPSVPSKKPGPTEFLVPRQVADSKPLDYDDLGSEARGNGQIHLERFEIKKDNSSALLSSRQQSNLLRPGIHFPDGTVKKTWAYGYPRKDDIKIEEVLQKDDLELAVLSAYQWNEEWILRKLNLSNTKVICVVQAENEEQKAEMRRNVPSSIKFCFPSMAGQINCMHSKLQLLSHPTHLRIVLPSANLMPYDWGEDGGIMENVVFIIDLPRLERGRQTTVEKLTPFGRELRYFLGAMEMESSIIESLLNFDYEKTANLAFIHSIGGSHSDSSWKRTGYCGLGSAVKELGLATTEALDIDYVTASIGNLSIDFIKSIYLAAQGDDGTTELTWRTAKVAQHTGFITQPMSNVEMTPLRAAKEIERGFRIYFPSRETVASSKGGSGAGGTICFQAKWYGSPNFPRSLMRDCKSERTRMLMHNKILFVRPQRPLRGTDEDGKGYVAWAYVGSANLSESAWGRLVKDKRTKQPKLNIRNWECGVVIPIPTTPPSSYSMKKSESREYQGVMNHGFGSGQLGMDVFEGFVPVPMAVPGEEYGQRNPWFYTEA